jgi:UDP-N-acetylglucosamine 2-epimerase (non-hydrolysing)
VAKKIIMSKNNIKIHLIAAARPNFMKIAPLYHALKSKKWAQPVIVHTGQHYDLNMSDVFFEDLGIPEPDVHLGVGSGTHAEQTGQVMMAYEKVLIKDKPDLVVVVGDVNSTMAATVAAVKINYGNSKAKKSADHKLSAVSYELGRPLVAHLEAGLRSFDRSMPEEINRRVTDALADILWTPSADADENLIREGVSKDKIRLVGNIMIDSLEMLRDRIQTQAAFGEFGLKQQDYGLVTLHRPSNVDEPEKLKQLFNLLVRISKKIPLVFNCRFAMTDSGGIQEETTYLGIPSITLRPNTERPITITRGTNRLCTLDNLEAAVNSVLTGQKRHSIKIELWDGHTAKRAVNSIKEFCN